MNENKANWLKNNGSLFLVVTVIYMIVGALLMYNFGPKKTEIEIKTIEKPIYIQGMTKHTQTNTVQYVEKEQDPVTGEVEKTDAEYRVEAPEITVKVNGETIAFQSLQNENRKFEDGKLLFEQSSKLNFDLKVPTIDRTKKRSLFYGIRSDGKETIKYSQNVKPQWGWYLEADGDFLQSQFKGDSMEFKTIGGGVRINF